ncbi:MAG TPA: glycoside hydrolase family 3 C-terminal domain-containing protein [Bacteroidota bacterium]|nr:glycoside hydrolase family 3 C-terminal domain-containing protein [Bacteroidota bacterium]
MKKILLFVVLLPLIASAQESAPYKNSSLSIEQRVNDLVSRMTLEEKVSQMVYNSPAIERLGIPEYNWWNESLHGLARNGIATVFPQAIGLAATWDPTLMNRISTVISDEARAKYNRATARNKRGIYQGITLWSPNINIFRDPRWGRGMETYGEDPYLTGAMGVEFVKGLQGTDPRYLKTIATPKHLAVHSGPEPDRHTFNAIVSDYDLRETYLPHFKRCVVEGHAQSVMCAYTRFRGEACCGSELLEQKILRDEWGFKGLVVSDCWAVPDMYNFHKIVKSQEEAAAVAVKSGTDLECGNSYPTLVQGVKDTMLQESDLDVSIKRVFTARMKLGMFDAPEMVPYSRLRDFDTKENKTIALEAARKSIVLLKNEKHLLPLRKDLRTVAVLGPNANDVEVLLGNYNGFPSQPVTPLDGIRAKLKNATVLYERGCELADGMPSFDVVGASFLYTAADRKQKGLRGEYFSNRDLKGTPAFTRIDKNIDFAWWDGAPDSSFDPDDFGIRWSGVLVPKKTGRYVLGGYGFNGFRIYVEDTLFVKFDGEFDPNKTYTDLQLTADKAYKIKIEFYKKLRYSFMQLIWSAPDDGLEQRAIAAAKKSDVVVMCMGLSPRLEGEEMKVEVKGFKGGDRMTLDLPESQSAFIKKIQALGKPVVLVLLNGSAVSVNWENAHLPAIVEAWYPGQSAGTAIADILFGDTNPSGRLPVTFYTGVDQLPDFKDYNMKNRTYRYFRGEPLYPFGYGLSYTTFTYATPRASKSSIGAHDSTVVTVDVTNTGKADGEEVVQLYVKAAGDDKPVKTLKGFQRVFLKQGETKPVTFTIAPETLSRWIDGKGFSVEPDRYVIMIGSSSAAKDLHTTDITVTK